MVILRECTNMHNFGMGCISLKERNICKELLLQTECDYWLEWFTNQLYIMFEIHMHPPYGAP